MPFELDHTILKPLSHADAEILLKIGEFEYAEKPLDTADIQREFPESDLLWSNAEAAVRLEEGGAADHQRQPQPTNSHSIHQSASFVTKHINCPL